MSQRWRFILFILLYIFLCVQIAEASPSIKVTVQVLDENHLPLEGADVIVWYLTPNKSGIGTGDRADKGKSNKDGKFSSSGESFMPQVTIEAKADGYYRSGKIVKFEGSSKLFKRWEPWNQTIEVVLKKKRNPVPMFIKGTNWLEVPAEEIPVGYDLEKGDWVIPYGTGTTSDFIFTFKDNIKAYRDYDLELILRFSNALDGIQEYSFDSKDKSFFKWPFEAPVDGYQNELVKKIHKIPGKTESNINRSAKYIFRVRTITDDQGNIITANYGKISNEFELSPEGSKFVIRYSYYFNPDGTRNLEEDLEQNLFDKK